MTCAKTDELDRKQSGVLMKQKNVGGNLAACWETSYGKLKRWFLFKTGGWSVFFPLLFASFQQSEANMTPEYWEGYEIWSAALPLCIMYSLCNTQSNVLMWVRACTQRHVWSTHTQMIISYLLGTLQHHEEQAKFTQQRFMDI